MNQIFRFEAKHQAKEGEIDAKIAAKVSCERNYKATAGKADWDPAAENVVVLPRMKINFSLRLQPYPTSVPKIFQKFIDVKVLKNPGSK